MPLYNVNKYADFHLFGEKTLHLMKNPIIDITIPFIEGNVFMGLDQRVRCCPDGLVTDRRRRIKVLDCTIRDGGICNTEF